MNPSHHHLHCVWLMPLCCHCSHHPWYSHTCCSCSSPLQLGVCFSSISLVRYTTSSRIMYGMFLAIIKTYNPHYFWIIASPHCKDGNLGSFPAKPARWFPPLFGCKIMRKDKMKSCWKDLCALSKVMMLKSEESTSLLCCGVTVGGMIFLPRSRLWVVGGDEQVGLVGFGGSMVAGHDWGRPLRAWCLGHWSLPGHKQHWTQHQAAAPGLSHVSVSVSNCSHYYLAAANNKMFNDTLQQNNVPSPVPSSSGHLRGWQHCLVPPPRSDLWNILMRCQQCDAMCPSQVSSQGWNIFMCCWLLVSSSNCFDKWCFPWELCSVFCDGTLNILSRLWHLIVNYCQLGSNTKPIKVCLKFVWKRFQQLKYLCFVTYCRDVECSDALILRWW